MSKNPWHPDYKYDISDAFRRNNPSLCKDYGVNAWSYQIEDDRYWNRYWFKNEAKASHGYPYTYGIQIAAFFGIGYYTAREQGIPNPHNFLKSHWFDWATFLRRFAIYGVAGGLVVGTLVFGDTGLALKRIYNRYKRLEYVDPSSGYLEGYQIPFTNK